MCRREQILSLGPVFLSSCTQQQFFLSFFVILFLCFCFCFSRGVGPIFRRGSTNFLLVFCKIPLFSYFFLFFWIFIFAIEHWFVELPDVHHASAGLLKDFFLHSSQVGMKVVTRIGDSDPFLSAGVIYFFFRVRWKQQKKKRKLVLIFTIFFFFPLSFSALCPTIFSPFGDRLMNTIHTHTR